MTGGCSSPAPFGGVLYSFLRVCQPMKCSPIVLRALAYGVLPNCFAGTGCSPLVLWALTFMGRAHWRSMRCSSIVSRACSLMGCSRVLTHGSASLLVFYRPAGPTLMPKCLRAPLGNELSFFCCWYRGLPFLPGNDVYGAWGA